MKCLVPELRLRFAERAMLPFEFHRYLYMPATAIYVPSSSPAATKLWRRAGGRQRRDIWLRVREAPD
jgi:hypothetical protein